MTPNAQNPGADLPLRDIHFPDAIGWWPPAPGWWLALLLILMTTAALLAWYAKTNQRRQLSKSVRSEFNQIEKAYRQNQNDLQLANSLSAFLRRVSISIAPREIAAGLTGEAWLKHLDSSIEGQDFSTGSGRCLVEAPYNPTTTIDGAALLKLCRQWIHAAV